MNKLLLYVLMAAVVMGVIAGIAGGITGIATVAIADSNKQENIAPVIATIQEPAANATLEATQSNAELDIEPVEQKKTTAKDIDFTITKFYLESPFLHLHAQTSIPRQTILLEIIEIGDFRDIDIAKIPITTDADGMVFLDNQWVRFRNGYVYKANFYYNNAKIASSTSGIVKQGKANFGFVTLSTQQPNQHSARIITQRYDNMRLYLDGETNIPLDHCIVCDIVRINETSRETRNVNKYITIKPDKNGEINVDGKGMRTISVPLGTGYYKLTLKHENTKDILCVLGLEVIKEEKILKAVNWVKNVYVPEGAI
jgi:hypothetical protein